MENIANYVKDTISEMKQVAWPTQKQAMFYTLLVIVISAIVAAFLGAFDYLFTTGINFLVTSL